MNGAPIVWSAPLLDRSGFADEARNFVLALDRAGYTVLADPFVWQPWQSALTSGAAERVERLLATSVPDRFVHVVHGSPYDLRRHPRASFAVARTMFETHGIPPGLSNCDEFDEVWVPSDFVVRTFTAAGLDPDKLRVVPEPFDADRYDPETPPLALSGLDERFTFLSVFSWHLRKGWDVLVRAYLEEFRPDEAVALVVKFEPMPFLVPTAAEAARQLHTFVRAELERSDEAGPPVILLDRRLSDDDMPRLYRSADAYVMASRGEGWGRPYMEAMAMGLPTIGSRAGGNLEFMTDDNAYLVDGDIVDVPDAGWHEVPWFRGHRWFEPSVPQLRTTMRRVFEERAEGAQRGARAREEILDRFGRARIARLVAGRFEAAGVAVQHEPPPPQRVRPAVVWEGDQFVNHSLAVVNRELCRALIGRDVEIALRSDAPTGPVAEHPAHAGLVTRWGRAMPEPDVHVRHTWPPRLDRPSSGRWVVMQPWEFGALPSEWAEPLAQADEIWVPSHHVRDGFVHSGLDPDKVVVIPGGVNPLRFQPSAPPMRLPTAKRFRFLFVGGTLFRKGADILLETYLATFSSEDDVCLVVKDAGTRTFYRGQGLGSHIRQLQADPRNPEILYLDEDWSDDELASLYTACHCLVHPYRAEGFGLPIAEAMACGLPVIVTGYGACLDFCDPTVSHLVPALEARSTVARLGDLETVVPPWWAEVDRDALARAMRDVVDRPQDAAAMGRRASERIRGAFTWAHAADRLVSRLEHLVGARPQVAGPPRRKRLSVCLIVKDEAAFLGACLDSVRAVADQVVVVDTGSTDETVAIAEEFGAEVHHFEWVDDFAAARNESLSHATGDWILVLDGDEMLDPTSHDELRRLLQSDELVGHLVRIRSYMAPAGTEEVLEHRTVRLFPNHPGLRFVGRDPHAQVQPQQPELPFTLRPCDVTIHHEGYRPQVLETRGKLERNRVLLERAVRDLPGDPFNAFNLGVTYALLGRGVDAERELLRAVGLSMGQVAAGRTPTYLVTGYQLLAIETFRQQRYLETVAHCEQALALAPRSSDLHVTLGSALLRLGRLAEAQTAYRNALEHADGTVTFATDRSTATWKPLLGLAQVELARGRSAAALQWLTRAHRVSPDNPEIATALARASLELGDGATAHELLTAVVERDDASPEARSLLAHLTGGAPQVTGARSRGS